MAHSRLCSIPDCNKPHYGRGLCHNHYQRLHRDCAAVGAKAKPGEALRYFLEVVLPYDGNECLIWPFSRSHGYGQVWFKGRLRRVHSAVCGETRGLPPTAKHQAAHSCGKGQFGCVTKRHLDWKTTAGNMADKLIHGTHNRGERHYKSKITDANIREMRALRGVVTKRVLAMKFGIGVKRVGDFQAGRRGAHVK